MERNRDNQRRHRLLSGIIPAAAVALLAACSIDLETSGNGAFDGYWHLERVDTLATGGTCDLSQHRVFWGVQSRLISVSDIDADGSRGYYLRFRQTADSIVTYSPYKNNWHQDQGDDGGDVPVEDPSVLAPYGIGALEEHFAKERLKGGTMVLRSERLRLWFKRF